MVQIQGVVVQKPDTHLYNSTSIHLTTVMGIMGLLWKSGLEAHHHHTAVPEEQGSGWRRSRGAGYQPVGEWGRRDVRLPELCKLASMLRLFLTASRECRLVRGVRLGMLCLSSSENHTHSLLNTLPAHWEHLAVWDAEGMHAGAMLISQSIILKGLYHAVFSQMSTNISLSWPLSW